MLILVSVVQGMYFLITGIWPLVSIGTFQLVTGPKTDLWLVKTVGVLIAVIGLGLLVAGVRNQVTPEIVLIGIVSAAGLGTIDIYYSLRGTISKIYLLDAVAEAVLIIAWIVSWLLSR